MYREVLFDESVYVGLFECFVVTSVKMTENY